MCFWNDSKKLITLLFFNYTQINLIIILGLNKFRNLIVIIQKLFVISAIDSWTMENIHIRNFCIHDAI